MARFKTQETFTYDPNDPFAAQVDDQQLSKLVPYLRVVTNNDAQHPGGGGAPGVCFAPPL